MNRLKRASFVWGILPILLITMLLRTGVVQASGAWKLIPGANPSATYDGLRGVTAVTTNDVWAVGARTPTSHLSSIGMGPNGSLFPVQVQISVQTCCMGWQPSLLRMRGRSGTIFPTQMALKRHSLTIGTGRNGPLPPILTRAPAKTA